ncbi:MAG: LysM peptidoglycan-binding domain-containing protein, partial [Fuerstia sp.]|nr:LysM peptidoglycan-binding domain-containing protein [Fuerstiella sp.]
DPVSVPLLFVPQLTAGTDGPLGTGAPRKPYVVAMTYVSSTPPELEPKLPTPFDQVARGALLWTLNAYLNRDKDGTTLQDILEKDISIDQLNEIYCYLTQKDVLEPFTEGDVLRFLENFYRFHVTIPPVSEQEDDSPNENVSVFPMMPLLKLTTSTGVDVDFLTMTPSSDAYLSEVKVYFEEMAVRYRSAAERANPQATPKSREETDKSLASFIFLDFFAMLARSAVQDAISQLQKQQAPLEADESLLAFVQRRKELAIDVTSLALANAARPLRAGVQLRVPGVVYTVKRGDTVRSVVAKLKLDPKELRRANPRLKGRLPAPAARLRLPTLTFTTSSTEPESLLDITRIYGISLAELVIANQDVAELFPAGQPLLAPYAQSQNVGELVEALQENGSFGNLSGLAARVLLQGLRPPSPKESPQGGEPAPLYELTGQQFDATGLEFESTITLSVPEPISRWFQLGDGHSLEYAVTQETAAALKALQAARFAPPVSFEPAELLRIEPRRFTLPTSVLWHTPTAIEAANPGINAPPETIEPQLWQFPSELLQVITGPQALQPKVELWTQRQEGPGQQYPREPVTNYTWSTRIDIQVRQTASGDKVFLPNAYELTGIDAGGTQLLENLIVWYGDAEIPVIDQIRILYPPDPAVEGQTEPPTGLKSDAAPTYFLLQTNLSTASQPPQISGPTAALLAAAAPQRDPLGQTDIEFLKLLWESSIVNSGGYVLYYESEPAKGLPDYLFSEDGVAPLTLLITYSITDNVLQNFLNNVVIHQAIDTENEVLYAAPVPQTVTNFQLSPDQSLADVAARYRVTVSRLATQHNNAHAKLAPGKHLRIPPLTCRVRAGERLETIAARARVTPEAVAALNPGVELTLLSTASFLRLPETVWRVEADDSLASLAERLSTTVVTLAHANRNVPGLVQGSLEFDDRLEQVIATIPPGNIAFHITRTGAVSANSDVDAGQQLAELYNLLGYRIQPVNGFEATNSALPISPVTPDTTSHWIYDSVVPVFPFFDTSGDARESEPSAKDDPYNGVGNTVVVNFYWQDLFGNWIDSDTPDQNWPDKGFPVDYIDELIALDQWPYVTSDYLISPGNLGDGSAVLSVTLRFAAAAYLPSGEGSDPDASQEMALTDLDKFRLIYYQLTQEDVSVTVSSTMEAVNPLEGAASPKEVMVGFVLEIMEFLTSVVAGIPDPDKLIEVAMSQAVADTNPHNLFALVVRLEIARHLNLVNDQFKDIPAASVVTSRVPANAGQDNKTVAEVDAPPPLSLQEFARQLETAFPSLKVLVAAPKTSLGQVAEEIWIARFAATATGIAFKIDGGKPLFFAVEPLARNLLSRPDVLVYPYQSGKFIGNETPVTTSQNSIDLDQLGRDFLAAMEQVLGPQFSAATWKLEYDSDHPPTDPQKSPWEAIV